MNRLAHTSSENDAQTLRDLSKSKVVFKRFVLSKQNSKDFQLFFFYICGAVKQRMFGVFHWKLVTMHQKYLLY